jgi:uncharacterized protein (TIGR02246 family)
MPQFASDGRGGCRVDDLEAIKQLKARYFRTLDTKDWDGYRSVFADDVFVDMTGSGGITFDGLDAFMDYVRSYVAIQLDTVHHGHMPEITLTSPTTATGIWAMEDRVKSKSGRDMTGFGHYHETYEKVGGEWRIKSMALTRLRTIVAG